MICFDTSFAQILNLEFWNERASLIMIVIAGCALIFTAVQLVSGRKESRRSSAYSAYQSYLKLCFDNSKLAFGDEKSISNENGVDPKYPWFIAQMLFSFEQILEINQDEEWNIAIKSQLNKHRWFLRKSKSANRDEWSNELKALLNEIINE